MTEEFEMQIGADAASVLESQAFNLAFDNLKQELTSQWMQSRVEDLKGRETLYMLLKLTNKVRINLECMMVNGKMAQEKRRTMLERAKAAKEAWDDSEP